jgi:hypothetical protein
MTPEERKAKNRLWRTLEASVERWEGDERQTVAGICRELRAWLAVDPPRPPGRPRGR